LSSPDTNDVFRKSQLGLTIPYLSETSLPHVDRQTEANGRPRI